MHSRRKIRDAVAALLAPHPLLTRLFEARTKAANEDALPFANVTTGAESVEDLADQFREIRTLPVMVTLVVRKDKGVADQLDDLAEHVENLLGLDPTLGGACEQLRYKGCEPDYTSAASEEAASLTLNYECKYVWEPSPDLDVLQTIEVQFDMAGPRNEPQLPSHPDGQVDAVATIVLPS